jgi:hypothetical protein
MHCEFQLVVPAAPDTHCCRRCGLVVVSTSASHNIHARCSASPRGPRRSQPAKSGPGTELKKLLAELGIHPIKNCGCESLAAKMNAWGPACREHRAEIIDAIRANWQHATIGEKLRIARAGAFAAIAGRINPLSPIGSMIDLAMERAAMLPGQ